MGLSLFPVVKAERVSFQCSFPGLLFRLCADVRICAQAERKERIWFEYDGITPAVRYLLPPGSGLAKEGEKAKFRKAFRALREVDTLEQYG